MRTVRKVHIVVLVCSLFFCASCKSANYAKKSLPLIAIGVIVLFVYRLYQDFFKIGTIDENVKEVRGDVQDLKGESRDIKTGVHEVKEDTKLLKESSGEIKEEVQDFRKETKVNFNDVRTDLLRAKEKLLQELDKKGKSLARLTELAKDEMKQELQEQSKITFYKLRSIKNMVKETASKQEIKILKDILDSMDLKLASFRGELIACIKESEAKQKAYVKKLLDDVDLKQEERFGLLKLYIQKLEKSNEGIKGLVGANNKELVSLKEIVNKICREVSTIKKLLLNM